MEERQDLISRQAAIDTVSYSIELCDKALDSMTFGERDRYAVEVERNSLLKLKDDLKLLPSAQPEPCEDVVSRKNLRLMKTEECAGHTIEYAMGWKACIEWIKTLPSAQPEPCEDAVSRKDCLNALSHMMDIDGFRDGWAVSRSNVECMLKSMPSVTPKEQGWIPCSKKSPEEKESIYWVCASGGYQCQARWTDDKFGLGVHTTWGWHFLDCPQYDKITAWMPLPEPYREEGGADGQR